MSGDPSPGAYTSAFLPRNPAVAALADLFDRLHREIHREAVRGPSELIPRVLELRVQAIRERFESASAVDWLRRARGEIDAFLAEREDLIGAPPLCEEDFVFVRDSLTPVLKRPEALSVALPARATETVLGLVEPGLRARVRSVFDRSSFPSGYLRFRTVARERTPCIVGEDGTTILHLAGIAHELGHCLYEEVHGWHDTRRWIESEACAQVVEDHLVRAALTEACGSSSEELAEWRAYQGRVDRLNLHYFRLESREIAGGAPLPPPFFAPHFHVFRESYFVNPGYQVVYAFASLLRSHFGALPSGELRSALTASPGWMEVAGFCFAAGGDA